MNCRAASGSVGAVAGLLMAGLLAGCGGDGTGGAPGSGGAGAGAGAPIIVDGSSTVFRISMAAQEAYDAVKPGARIVVDNHGTGGGFGRYIEGEVDIVDASRAAKADEETKAKAKGYDWTRFLVAHDGITLAVNKQNDWVTTLSVEQLARLFALDSPVKTWKDLDPAWPDRKIVIYTPDDDSGTYEFFNEAILGKEKSPRKDVQANSDDNILVTGVAGDKDGLGYFGYAYYAANSDRLRALGVTPSEGGDAVAPSPETIHTGAYKPLARPLYIYVKNSAMKRPDVAAFVRFYLENLETLAEKAGYVAPTVEERAENARALASLLGGEPAKPAAAAAE